MSKTEQILKQLKELERAELEIILDELVRRINRSQQIKEALLKVKGKGKGVWTKEGEDAQEYINNIRENDRCLYKTA